LPRRFSLRSRSTPALDLLRHPAAGWGRRQRRCRSASLPPSPTRLCASLCAPTGAMDRMVTTPCPTCCGAWRSRRTQGAGSLPWPRPCRVCWPARAKRSRAGNAAAPATPAAARPASHAADVLCGPFAAPHQLGRAATGNGQPALPRPASHRPIQWRRPRAGLRRVGAPAGLGSALVAGPRPGPAQRAQARGGPALGPRWLRPRAGAVHPPAATRCARRPKQAAAGADAAVPVCPPPARPRFRPPTRPEALTARAGRPTTTPTFISSQTKQSGVGRAARRPSPPLSCGRAQQSGRGSPKGRSARLGAPGGGGGGGMGAPGGAPRAERLAAP
jgi:hypothetical protein